MILAIRCMMQLDCNTCDLKMYRTLSHGYLFWPVFAYHCVMLDKYDSRRI